MTVLGLDFDLVIFSRCRLRIWSSRRPAPAPRPEPLAFSAPAASATCRAGS
jgi:hypothetical protein